jgi:hypothetical protein
MVFGFAAAVALLAEDLLRQGMGEALSLVPVEGERVGNSRKVERVKSYSRRWLR